MKIILTEADKQKLFHKKFLKYHLLWKRRRKKSINRLITFERSEPVVYKNIQEALKIFFILSQNVNSVWFLQLTKKIAFETWNLLISFGFRH